MNFIARRGTWVALLLGLVLSFLFYHLMKINDLATNYEEAGPWIAAAFVAYFAMSAYVIRFWGQSFISIELLVGFAIVFRVMFLFSEPNLSDDLYRYIWDGNVSVHGINPYRYEPQSELLAGLRDDAIYPHINHKDIPTIYPPLTQWVFQSVAWISLKPVAMKAAMVLFDLGTLLVMLAMLKQVGRALSWVVVYAWNPLVIVEIAGSGHMDTIGVFFVMTGILAALKARSIWASGIIGLAFVSKMAGAPFLVFFEDVRYRWKTVLLLLVVFGAIVLLCYWPFLDASDQLFTALGEYTSRWEFNGFIYTYLKEALEWFFRGDTNPKDFFGILTDNKPRLVSKMILGTAFVIFYGILIFRHYVKSFGNQKINILRAAYLITSVLLLVSPTLHPWYVVWIIPFLCFYPNPGWFIFSGLVLLTYSILPEYRSTGIWHERDSIILIQYVPFYSVFLFFVARSFWRKRKAHPSIQAD